MEGLVSLPLRRNCVPEVVDQQLCADDVDDEEKLTSCAMFGGPSKGRTLRGMVNIYSSCLS
jgi:hypothetical protein